MISALTNWFAALSQREKILIGLLGFLLAATIGFYGIYQPLSHGVQNAQDRYQEAVERQARIDAKVTALQQPASSGEKRASGSLGSYVSQSAGETGIAVGRIDPQTDGRVNMAVDSAKPTALFGWLSRLEAQGIFVEALNAKPNGNDTVTANIALRSGGGQ